MGMINSNQSSYAVGHSGKWKHFGRTEVREILEVGDIWRLIEKSRSFRVD